MNVYCRAKGISDKNFGKILDNSTALSQELVDRIAQALREGQDIEKALVDFFNHHKKTFNLLRALKTTDKDAIQHKFEIAWRTITATPENPHMDDFMLLDAEIRGENAKFITYQGLIGTDFANIVSDGPNQDYFAEIRREAAANPDFITPQDAPVVTIDIEPEALVNKLDNVQWDKLPAEVAAACRALPTFQVRQLLDDVAKGKQNEAHALLQASADTQTLLRTPGKFTDYSGRTFYCTAYEYAWWAKDTHMRRMLEGLMDDETKALLLARIDEIERSGLAYQQHGVAYQNPHYDMSFVLKNLSPDEFCHLQALVGQNNVKIREATVDNYRTLAFTATEYEQLKQELTQHKVRSFMPAFCAHFQLLCYLAYPVFFLLSLVLPSPAENLCNKLQFDFHSLITALATYVNNYNRWGYHERDMAWLSIGKAQRDVPACYAQEYCRTDRSFDPLPPFNEETLPRGLSVNHVSNSRSWFPLASSSSGLGFYFAVLRDAYAPHGAAAWPLGHAYAGRPGVPVDLAAVRHLDEVRIADFTQSRENLEQPVSQIGLRT